MSQKEMFDPVLLFQTLYGNEDKRKKDIRLYNERLAFEAVNAFTRMKLLEQGFYRSIMPPEPINDAA